VEEFSPYTGIAIGKREPIPYWEEQVVEIGIKPGVNDEVVGIIF
jgi:hypothetical protein